MHCGDIYDNIPLHHYFVYRIRVYKKNKINSLFITQKKKINSTIQKSNQNYNKSSFFINYTDPFHMV